MPADSMSRKTEQTDPSAHEWTDMYPCVSTSSRLVYPHAVLRYADVGVQGFENEGAGAKQTQAGTPDTKLDDPGKNGPTEKTPEEQRKADEDARRRAIEELVKSWTERLRLISLMTMFFASAEAYLLDATASEDQSSFSIVNVLASGALLAALILHVFSAIVAFLASFGLVRYRVRTAKREEVEAILKAKNAPLKSSTFLQRHDLFRRSNPVVKLFRRRESIDPEQAQSKRELEMPHSSNSLPLESIELDKPPPDTLSPNAHVERVGPFANRPPTTMLQRSYMLCVCMSTIGFLFTLTGIGCYSFAKLPGHASAFGSAVLATCLVISAVTFLWPERRALSGSEQEKARTGRM